MDAWVHYIPDEKSVLSLLVKNIQNTHEAVRKAKVRKKKLNPHLNNGYRIYGVTKVNKEKNYG
jgi:hypothetical protein